VRHYAVEAHGGSPRALQQLHADGAGGGDVGVVGGGEEEGAGGAEWVPLPYGELHPEPPLLIRRVGRPGELRRDDAVAPHIRAARGGVGRLLGRLLLQAPRGH